MAHLQLRDELINEQIGTPSEWRALGQRCNEADGVRREKLQKRQRWAAIEGATLLCAFLLFSVLALLEAILR